MKVQEDRLGGNGGDEVETLSMAHSFKTLCFENKQRNGTGAGKMGDIRTQWHADGDDWVEGELRMREERVVTA